MHPLVLDIAVGWLALLLAACVFLLGRQDSLPPRIVALDTLVLVLVALLAVFASDRGETYYLDVALMLALLGFVATVAAARYHDEGRPL